MPRPTNPMVLELTVGVLDLVHVLAGDRVRSGGNAGDLAGGHVPPFYPDDSP